jgi:hypothetical protein
LTQQAAEARFLGGEVVHARAHLFTERVALRATAEDLFAVFVAQDEIAAALAGVRHAQLHRAIRVLGLTEAIAPARATLLFAIAFAAHGESQRRNDTDHGEPAHPAHSSPLPQRLLRAEVETAPCPV